MLTEILLIRHGEALNNIPQEGLDYAGHHPTNPPLTALGRQQAQELKGVIEEFAPEAVIVSPFHRAIQTIHPYVEAHPDVIVQVDIRMGERFYGEVFSSFPGIDPGHYRQYGDNLMPDEAHRNRESFPDFPETRESVSKRVSALFTEWDDREIARAAFVGHGASLAALLHFLIPAYANNTGHGNCGYSHLEKISDTWTARRINCQQHLTRTNGQVVH